MIGQTRISSFFKNIAKATVPSALRVGGRLVDMQESDSDSDQDSGCDSTLMLSTNSDDFGLCYCSMNAGGSQTECIQCFQCLHCCDCEGAHARGLEATIQDFR